MVETSTDYGTKLDRVYEFDLVTNQWNQKASMPTARSSCRLAYYDGKIWAIGGATNQAVSTVEIYDVTTNACSEGPSLTMPRYGASVWVENGRILAGGGYDGTLSLIPLKFTTLLQWNGKAWEAPSRRISIMEQ